MLGSILTSDLSVGQMNICQGQINICQGQIIKKHDCYVSIPDRLSHHV